jgi:hypothetical protein
LATNAVAKQNKKRITTFFILRFFEFTYSKLFSVTGAIFGQNKACIWLLSMVIQRFKLFSECNE